MTMTNRDATDRPLRDYPPGVPCWIDLEVADPADAMRFYAGLFDWAFDDANPPGSGGTYFVARKDGQEVAGIGLRPNGATDVPRWTMYVCVDDIDAVLARVRDAGGEVTGEAQELPGAARVASVSDPVGADLRLWEPRGHPGVQLVNVPGTWNMNELSTPDVDRAIAFYGAVFGWELDPLDFGGGTTWMARVPGYGAFLARRDPEIYERQTDAGVPPGFADAVAWVSRPAEDLTETPQWGTIFAVADTDAIARRVTELGGSILVPPMDASEDVRLAVVTDPAGAVFTISRYAPSFEQD